MKRKKKWLFASLAILIGIVGSLVVMEVAVRVHVASRGWTPNCYVTGAAFFVPHEKAGHTLRPNLRMKSSSYDISINSVGLRGDEVTSQKPSDCTRVMVLGGSSVFGYLVPDGQDSCRVLESILSKDDRLQDRKVEVLNAGVPGYNMTQCRLRYEADLAALKPDIVLLYLGWNDIRYLAAPNEAHDKTPPGPSLWQRILIKSTLYGMLRYRIFPPDAPVFVPPAKSSSMIATDPPDDITETFRKDFRALISSIRKSGARAVVCTQLMAAGQDDSNLKQFLGSTPEQIEANDRLGTLITDAIRDEAKQSNVPLIDVAKLIQCDRSLLGDAIHLTKQGHYEVAVCWADTLAPLIADSSSLTDESP